MKLALDIGSGDTTAAWTASAPPTLLPVGDGRSPFLASRLLWQNGNVLGVGQQATKAAAVHGADTGAVLLEGFRQDFAVTRLRYLEADSANNPRLSQAIAPREYEGPFFRRGLVEGAAAILRTVWSRLEELDAASLQSLERLYLGIPMHFHEFSRRRFLFALKRALADRWKPAAEFYRQAIQQVSFVHEPLAVLAALAFLYEGRASEAIEGTEPRHILLVDMGAGTSEGTVIRLAPQKAAAGRLVPEPILSTVSEPAAGHAIDRAMLDGIRKLDPDLDLYVEHQLIEPAFRAALMDALRTAKHQFADPNTAGSAVQIPDGSPIQIERTQFNEWLEPVTAKVKGMVERCVEGAGLHPTEIDHVVLVGGSALMPDMQAPLLELFGAQKVVAPDLPDQEDARSAVVKGLAYLETFGKPIHLTPGERKLKLFETNWNPEVQSPPPQEQFRVVYDPLKPEANQHKNLWWGHLQVPSGYRRLTVSVFESLLSDEHVFTLYGIPLLDDSDPAVPERFQVYFDPREERVIPKIWVWDVSQRDFLVKGFDISRQPEEALARFVEGEEPAFGYRSGGLNREVPDESQRGWLAPVKRLARGDYVRVYAGDRQNPAWRNTAPGPDGTLQVPVQRVTRIYPANAPAFVGPGIPQCASWRLSDYRVALDDEEEPRNLQALDMEHVPDQSVDAPLTVEPRRETSLLRNAVRPQPARPSGASAAQAASPAGGTFEEPEDVLATAQTEPQAGTASAAGDGSNLRESQRIPVPDNVPFPAGEATYQESGATAEPAEARPVDETSDPFGEIDSAFEGAAAEDSAFSAEDSADGINWTADHGKWFAGGMESLDAQPQEVDALDPASFPESLTDTSSGTVPSALRETGVWQGTLEQLLAAAPSTAEEARVILETLLRHVANDEIPPEKATALATIVHALRHLR